MSESEKQPNDLEKYAQLARRHVEEAARAERFIVICVRLENDRVHCQFDACNYPGDDLATAEDLIAKEFAKCPT